MGGHRWLVFAVAASGCSSDPSSSHDVVIRHSTEAGPRLAIVDGFTAQGDELPTAPVDDGEATSQECLGWFDGLGVVLANRNGWWRYTDGGLSPFPFGELRGGNDLTLALIAPGEFAIVSRLDGGQPGLDPPPSASDLGVIDADGNTRLLASAGRFGQLSAGIGGVVIARAIAYIERAEDPSWRTVSKWQVFVGDREIEPGSLHDGAPIVAPTGDRIAWAMDDSTAITDLDGNELVVVDRTFDGGSWSPGASAFAGFDGDGVWTFHLEDARTSELSESTPPHQLVWAPTGDRLLIEARCEAQDKPFRQQVFADGMLERETPCAPRTFAGWSADGATFALNDFEERPFRFLLDDLDGSRGPIHDGTVCGFRPSE